MITEFNYNCKVVVSFPTKSRKGDMFFYKFEIYGYVIYTHIKVQLKHSTR